MFPWDRGLVTFSIRLNLCCLQHIFSQVPKTITTILNRVKRCVFICKMGLQPCILFCFMFSWTVQKYDTVLVKELDCSNALTV